MKSVIGTILIALVYFLSAKVVTPLSLVESSSVFAIWPPTGVALSFLLLYGYRSWAGIALGALFLNMTLTPFLPSLQIAVTNTAGPLLAAYLINSYTRGFDFFDSVHSMILFFIAITLASLMTALGGSAALMMHGFIADEAFLNVLYGWFFGDLIGFLVVTPLAVAWKLESKRITGDRRWGEVLAVFFVLVVSGLLFFGPAAIFDLKNYPTDYMLIIPILWASIRFGALGGSVAVMAAMLVVTVATIFHHGPFVRPDPNDSLFLLQSFVWFMALIALFSATVLRQKEAVQASLEKNTTEWVNALDQVNDVVYILDLGRKLVRANRAFYTMMQTTPEASLGRHITEIVHPQGEEVPCPVCRAQEAKVDAVITMEADDPDNPGGRPIEITVKMIRDKKEKPSAILMMIHDLSESRKMDEQQRLAATVFESTAEGLLITDARQHILALNQAACKITGYEKEELIGKVPPLFVTEGMYEAQDNGIMQQIEKADFWSGEIDARNKAGASLPLWFHINTVRDTNGKSLNYVILFLDISERKKAEAAVREYQTTLENRVKEELAKREEQEQILIQQSKLAAMGEMVGMIAHQWRQPLSALGLMVQDLSEAYEFGELNQEYLNNTVSESMKLLKHMSGTIDDFRNFFKKDKEKQSFSTEDVMENVLTVIGASLKNNGIRLILSDREPVTVFGYYREYTQVVLNIINNAKDALKRCDKEEKWLRIEWSEPEEGKSRLEITDNGGGIPEAILSKIYDPYFTTKEQGHGTGIGLYMSKMIIERHMMGRLREENTGEGARFIIEV